MTIDPAHYDGIARLARRIHGGRDASEHRDLAGTVWREFLDPLRDGEGRAILEPIEEVTRLAVDAEAVALTDAPFETVHGLDAGTINPTTFRNGLVVDVAQAAMAATPSDLDLHRHRTVVASVHASDATATVDDRWDRADEGYLRSRAIAAPRVSRFAEGVVHATALYLAESEHALAHADAVGELLVLDGPIYPRGLLRWEDRHPELRTVLAEEQRPREVLANYVRLVERFAESDRALVGFVKNPASKVITRALSRADGPDLQPPWSDDAQFFTRVLEQGELVDDVEGRRWERETGELTATGWFRSRGGVDRVLSIHGDALGVDRELDPAAYEVTFFALYDPRTDLLYRVEAPWAIVADEDRRERLTRWALRSVAASRGAPEIIGKADELARISAPEKAALRETLEERFETTRDRSYDDRRWGEEFV